MMKEEYCRKVCQTKFDNDDFARLTHHIKHGYHNNWIIDNLPSAAIAMDVKGRERKLYSGGFPIGFMDEDRKVAYVYNHVNINID
jgi:transmembrane 9 superfamily member 2/4